MSRGVDGGNGGVQRVSGRQVQHLRDNACSDAGRRRCAPASVTAATLPPLDRKTSEVAALLAAPRNRACRSRATYEVEPYKPKLSLQGVSQPVVGVGVSRFGTSFGGGIALTFGDQLGNHLLATALQVNTGIAGSFSVKDIGAQVAYINQSHRWNWGLVGGQMPYLSSGFQSASAACRTATRPDRSAVCLPADGAQRLWRGVVSVRSRASASSSRAA